MASRTRRTMGLLAVAAMIGSILVPSVATASPDLGDDLVTGRYVVRDIDIPVRGQDPVAAWLVRPVGAAEHAQAGVLWLHWLGEIHGDRSQFLAEAIELAGDGVVSVLPQGTFPWRDDPVGDERDVAAVKAQRSAFRAALNLLKDHRLVDPHRIGVVGHDYGGMYGTLLADRDHDVSTLVLAAPDATWGNWFAKFWLGLVGEEAEAYAALFDGLDPVEHADRLGDRVLIQWAGNDFYIPPAVREAYAQAAPEAQTILYPGVDHEFTTEAQIDRDAFLREQLDLG